MKNKAMIVIPAYNPPMEILKQYINDLKNQGFNQVIVVNDGSDDSFTQDFHSIKDIILLTHKMNRGKGVSIKTAFKYYLENNLVSSGLITVDADGQHSVSDVQKLNDYLKEDSILLGVRDFNLGHVPFKSRYGNKITRTLFRLFYGKSISDTQTGLRAFPHKLVGELSQLSGDRYEYELKVLMHASIHNIPMVEVPIETIYIDENASSHFHAFKDSYKIYKVLLGSFVKFSSVSFSSFLLDIGLFTFFLSLFETKNTQSIFIATIIARILSGIYNYLMNHYFVFYSKEKQRISFTKYVVLAIVEMGASALLVSILYRLTTRNASLLKIIVDAGLFFVSYRIEQKHIFKER